MSYSLTRPEATSRNLAAIAHLAGWTGLFLPLIGPIAIPVVILALKADDEFVREHAMESLNLEVTLWLAITLFGLLSIVLIGLPFLFVTILFGLIAPIPAAIAAATGESHRYRFIIRFFH